MIGVSWILLLLSLATSIEAAFRETPRNESVVIGADVVFKCAAQRIPGNYELYSQWKSNTGALLGFHDAGQLTGHQGRYSYLKETSEELNLRIEKVTLEDDGAFECQMLRPDAEPIRASAFLNVIVPPSHVMFTNYHSGSTVEVNEDTPMLINCSAINAKPAAKITWYINGRKLDEDDIVSDAKININKTSSTMATLQWSPRRGDHKKLLTCEATHPESRTTLRTNITLNILYPPDRPKVSIVSGDNFVRAGDNVTLLCVVTGGNPSPTAVWYVNDKPIGNRYSFDHASQETRNSYSFLADARDNLANYECRAQNRESAAPVSRGIHIKVAYAPKSVEVHGEHSIRQGTVTSVQCRSSPSNPAAKISWLINGHPIPSTIQSEHQQAHGIVSLSNLTINTNEVMSSGKHRLTIECTARNDEGAVSKQHSIKVLSPPMAPRISGLEDNNYFEGDTVNVTCEAHGGHPLADITWYRGYEKLTGVQSSVSGEASSSTLTVTIDRTMNGQRLKCEAHNSALDEPLVDSRNINVVFAPRRVLIRTPEGSRHQLMAGVEAKLLCAAPASNPASIIQWHLHPNGESVPLIYNGLTIINETTRESGYTVENVVSFTPTEAHDGTIARCIVSNPLWPESKNQTFPLNVYYAPRLLVDSPISIVVLEGESFRENLTVKSNPPVSAWRWRKNGASFDHTIGNVFARGATLSGRNVLSTDAGIYTLYAINSVGTANVSIQLVVEYSPVITKISKPVVATEGTTVNLECEVDAVPKKSDMIHWYRDGHKLPSTRYSDVRSVLTLNATQEGTGEYTCVADNGIGEPGKGSAFLLVNTAPRIQRIPLNSRAAGQLGGRARARCRAVAVPDVDFVWDRSGEFIKTNSSKYTIHTVQIDYTTFESTLVINSISPDDYSAELRCTARNSLGTDTVKIPIGPQSPPETPNSVKMTNSTATTITLSWQPGFDGGSDQMFEIRYQRDGEMFHHATNTTHHNIRFADLTPAKVYYFQVRAINARGFSSEMSHPALQAATLNEDGVDVAYVSSAGNSFEKQVWFFIVLALVLLLLINGIILCHLSRRNRKKKLQEKTEMVRTAINGDGVRPVQMYGTMLQADMPPHCVDREDMPEPSEDDHSVRTMIEVNPNGYMQQIDPALYERNCLVEYEFDPRDYPSSRHGTLGRPTGTYTNMPYPEPPNPRYSGTLSRRYMGNNNNNNNSTLNSNNNSPQHLSTFIKPNGVRPGPMHYSQLDGDLV